ncbi:hypothetical protein DITRI_Ditri18aG0056500 [Diplodiscus trichospermus]
MSSRYQILDNRPIDQWRVTELKEELKRRKLTTRGLKEDLVKRLDEALRIERENTPMEADNGTNSDPEPVVEGGLGKAIPVIAETVKDVVDHGGSGTEKESGVKVQVDINDSEAALVQGEVQGRDILVEEEPIMQTTTVQNEITITKTVVSEVPLIGQDLQSSGQEIVNSNIQVEYEDSKPQVENEEPKPQVENEGPKPEVENEGPKPEVENDDHDPKPQLQSVGSEPQLENDDPKPQLDIDDSKAQLENEGLKAPTEDDMRDSSTPNNQVSEVSPILGFQVKSDSISTDSVSINEKIELKDNIIADNVKLDLDVVKLEMVEPSSCKVVPISGESHPMDVEEPLENKNKASVDERDDKNVTNADMSNKIDSAEMGYSEKLNLDRSSGDDSMEEDVLESKQIDSKCSTDEMGEKSEKNEVPLIKEESPVDVVGDGLSAEKKDVFVESNSRSSVPAEKRKLHDQEAVGNNEPSKRRKWNSDNIKVPEQQGSNLTPTTTPKDTTQPTALKRNFSRSDSTASEETPKERVVPPSQNPPTTSLRIDRFLRPFTLKAVQELLGKTGTVTSFWMDHIKTHCYVTYSSVEEAIETRNAVYNLQWPANGGRLLVADFVDPQEVKIRLEAPPQTPTTPGISVTSGSAAPQAQPTSQPRPSPRQQVSRQPLPPPSALPPPPPLSSPPTVRERLPLPPPPPEKLDPPIVTLDDLFRKTKATPRIYYLPLSEEQVAAQGRNTKQ